MPNVVPETAMTSATPRGTELPAVQEWKDLLAEIVPPQGAWSEQAYLALTDQRNRLIEYTDGFLEVLPMPTDRHQSLLKFLLLAFSKFFDSKNGQVLFAALRLQIRPGKYREPDLLVLFSADDPRRQNRFWLGADIVLEVVSEDNPQRDLAEKVGNYAEAGVPEYWIIDPLTDSILIFELRGNKYEEPVVYKRGETARSISAPDFSVAVSAVFDAGRIR